MRRSKVPPPAVAEDSVAAAAVFVDPKQLKPWPKNPRKNDQTVQMVVASIRRFGFASPIVVQQSTGMVIGGHTRLKAALHMGLDLVPVRYMDLNDDEAHALAIADNKIPETSEWNDELLTELMTSKTFEIDAALGFSDRELQKLLSTARDESENTDNVPAMPTKPQSKLGEIYELGPHRLLCGDSTSSETIARLLGDVVVDLLLTDPPYCSGGFQETGASGKAQGSIGTKRNNKSKGAGEAKQFAPKIANDTLSTKGFQALIGRVLELWPAKFLYCFTDWRMWSPLFDVAERSGFGVRSMIVWDKGNPGMGAGWRSQHELVLFATKVKQKFDLRRSIGNVISSSRSGNDLHPTQKPEELTDKIISVNLPFSKTAADPFAGSGTTLISCARSAITWRGAELSPGFCDVIRLRWGAYAREHGIEPGAGAL